MVTLIWNDLRHHARQWLWSLLVATVGGAIIGVIITAWYSALSWAQAQGSAELVNASHLIGSNLVSYAGLATAVILSTTLGLTVSAQQRSHALWKVLGIPGSRIRRIILGQVGVIGLLGGAIGAVASLPLVRLYLLTWRELEVFPPDLPIIMPGFGVPLTIAVTTLFCILGGMGAARRAASVPEMQALREASAPRTRTRWWQWVIVAVLVLAVVVTPFDSTVPLNEAERAELVAAGVDLNDPGERAVTGGAMGLLAAIAGLCVPNWTLRPLLTWWTALVPGRSPAWFAARANARHRASLSMTTIVPFAIAVAMTGTVYAAVGAGQATGAQGSVNGFLTVGVPIFLISGVGGIANIAMVGRARRQEGALLGVIGARTGTVLASTALEGVIYAVTGIVFGLAATAFSAIYAALYSGGGMTVLVASVPVGLLALVSGISLALAVATTWLPAQLDRRSLMDNLRQPV
ncbi:FtsX-like permease family protein [Actinomyces sp. oral taxon 171]|uniref:FtsX-like permease family protein n=1 Tax=Actinomyces sp. oral taxon 171 TaxID=706438 RepID=UPI0001F622DB|nr:FtsX-like permease family protein [Actinomyces sp. oral taxon 171]EFW25738.1 efflux ABC transporter, permease protein [Actinomyces sp. oral taxon 171 str. F0337]QCT32292.1 ABC transporter permease [Actinomyces sp. oral taxon 171 str. F0337]